jgi:hypothetical protein
MIKAFAQTRAKLAHWLAPEIIQAQAKSVAQLHGHYAKVISAKDLMLSGFQTGNTSAQAQINWLYSWAYPHLLEHHRKDVEKMLGRPDPSPPNPFLDLSALDDPDNPF